MMPLCSLGRSSYSQYRTSLLPDTWQPGWEYEVTPTMLIDRVVYQDEASFEKYHGHLWRGYGKYPLLRGENED